MDGQLNWPRRKEMTKSRILLVVFMAVFAQLSSAQPTVELIWTEKNGNPLSGSSTVRAKAGDELTLDILVTGDESGHCGAVLNLSWDPGILTGLSGAEECPNPPFATAGNCLDPQDPPETQGWQTIVGVAQTTGQANGFDAAEYLCYVTGYPRFVNDSMVLGRTKFIVVIEDTSEVSVNYNTEQTLSGGIHLADGLNQGTVVKPPAIATVLPPAPGC
jgi:hypothetical protein